MYFYSVLIFFIIYEFRYVKGYTVKKIRHLGDTVYFSLATSSEAHEVIKLLNGFNIKGRIITAKIAPYDVKLSLNKNPSKIRSAKEIVTPLGDCEYDKQLELKMQAVSRVVKKLIKELDKANIAEARKLSVSKLVEPIRPSPVVKCYRNKCEFTVGRTINKDICVGFVGGRFALNEHHVIPIDTCDNISSHMKRIVKTFEEFIIGTGEPPFDESERKGCWRMLTVREFAGDVMLIVTVYPLEDLEKEILLKNLFIAQFLRPENFIEPTRKFRVTSLYWQRLINASDAAQYEHIGGTPYIYETILNIQFRVSPAAFFQTNSSCAAVLYSLIVEKCGFINSDILAKYVVSEEELCSENDAMKQPDEKKRKIVSTLKSDQALFNTLLLDICCGTGTIGICVLKLLKCRGKRYLIGIECVHDAVEDARSNAIANGFDGDEFQFITGKAEVILPNIKQYIPASFNLSSSKVIGILDPPRAGVPVKVIQGCRKLSDLCRLIYVSCNPSLVKKNLVDLCRPTSKKYEGKPFCIKSITPVDMFPKTSHCECVIYLER
ncbi:unnamed protein product [Dracunculus medinensis]|uniref:tRNA (uracil(54)-C(5))-methyltransferase n=1 Tax=Dracunculus medinensis TaxID=318479 RepID=A0A3P7PY39_DRAME|nr:unnamed protein product [Dracunculus medinensis]